MAYNQTKWSKLQPMFKEIKKEEVNFIPKANNFQEKNSIFNCIIHIIYFTPEIFSFWDKNGLLLI